ncbi:hypothetical protein HPB52_023508 [Rhipicephalus sanguineus]|uniref:Mutator-like transposase domain-containing protein n=1 Tax=Rhipicephalus sanguineus TaxID=34632 RepID=A0A9D4TC50_RHISA|nr:hypothetical protein HPB52_023508 [Rhipicephalus sanguineus]
MGTALRTIVTKSKKDQPIGGKGGLTQNLIKQLTDYYGQALRQHDEVEDMQRAVMATFYHTTSTDQDPHHEFCPPGPDSWCRHRAAEAKGEPQPPHKYHLGRHVAAALLPVYQRLSDPQLLERQERRVDPSTTLPITDLVEAAADTGEVGISTDESRSAATPSSAGCASDAPEP